MHTCQDRCLNVSWMSGHCLGGQRQFEQWLTFQRLSGHCLEGVQVSR